MSQTKQNYCSIFSTFGDETFSIVGVVAGFAALIFIGTGIWQAMKASKLKMEGNQEAYKMASNVMIGAFIGGALMAAVAAFLAIGVVQGNNFFGGGGGAGTGGTP